MFEFVIKVLELTGAKLLSDFISKAIEKLLKKLR